jgi:hypothetical protein
VRERTRGQTRRGIATADTEDTESLREQKVRKSSGEGHGVAVLVTMVEYKRFGVPEL